ncbi:hypothetical protein FJZ26_06175, partial [Candidatus Parvarchaeota archaeon]|nr:hypothetical protein [Candidatus Parvarchaeota archaeon]
MKLVAMGFFSAIGQIFRPKKEERERAVSLPEFEKWIDDLKQIKLRTVNDELRNYKARIEEQRKLVLEAIEQLKNAQLPNPNIPPRAKSLMEGNRELYAKTYSRLADGAKAPEKYEDVEYFIARWDSGYENAVKSTQRAYFVLQEFLANESKDVAARAREMGRISDELKEFVRKEGFEVLGRI